MHDSTSSQPTAAASPLPSAASSRTVAGIAILLAAYAAAAVFGWPQHGRDLLVRAQAAHATGGHDAADHSASHDAGHDDAAAHAGPGTAPPPVTVLPFAVLLAAIAILPLTSGLSHWWEHNSSKLLVAGGLALLTLVYYAFMHRHPVDLHFPTHALVPPAASGASWGVAGAVVANSMLSEYVPFIVLLFALYCITGGVRIEGDLEATPTVNAAFLGLGALAASFIGTTGAAMLLVRPLLETNRERRIVAHTIVFFIFMVCNCGGCLLPIGDPPLFLGYLEGVDFLWTFSLWKPWLFTNVILLAIYWLWDTFYAHPRERAADIQRDIRMAGRLRVSGIWPNALLMAGVIAAVALLDPAKAVPGTDWHPWMFLREAVLLTLVALSLTLGSPDIRSRNGFTYGAILEVAALFLGIFVCMQPALALLHEHGASLGIDAPKAFFWATGALSSVLDNAPTDLGFFKAAQAQPPHGRTLAGGGVGRLAGVTLGAGVLG
ncbi:MAG: sodium:proton antiporter, partial [Planctomycetia bacterium]